MAMREKDEPASSNSTNNNTEEERGLLTNIVLFIFGLIKWSCISILFSILVSFVGVTFIWPEDGSNHEKQTLEKEVTYLADELRNSSFLTLLTKTQETSLWTIPDKFGSGVSTVSSFFTEKSKVYAETANYSMRIFLVRFIILISSLPILFIYTFAAIVIGLVERDLRRFNLARESSTKFHLILNNAHLPLITLMMCYLSWPVTAYPLPFILPGYILFGLLVFTMVAGYKKYF
ncbi:MAG: DUF4400 domain-containing protein [Cocleimonas sp.]